MTTTSSLDEWMNRTCDRENCLIRPPTLYDDGVTARCTRSADGEDRTMPKGQEKKKTTNKPKLTVKEKKAKKKEKK